jgi:hypothetical protein
LDTSEFNTFFVEWRACGERNAGWKPALLGRVDRCASEKSITSAR